MNVTVEATSLAVQDLLLDQTEEAEAEVGLDQAPNVAVALIQGEVDPGLILIEEERLLKHLLREEDSFKETDVVHLVLDQ